MAEETTTKGKRNQRAGAPRVSMRDTRGFACPNCRAMLRWNARTFDAFFRGRDIQCPQCHIVTDFWRTSVDYLKKGDVFGTAVTLLGASLVVVRVTVAAHKTLKVNLTRVGVPKNSIVLYMSVTSVGASDVFPLLVHPNRAVPQSVGSAFILYGQARPESTATTEAWLSIVWSRREGLDPTAQGLIEAASHYIQGNYDRAIIPANVASEVAVSRVVKIGFDGMASKDDLKRFLDVATAVHKLNVLLKALAVWNGVPALPDPIRGLCNRLRDLRNALAHAGQPKSSYTKKDLAEMITASLFTVQYARFLSNVIRRKRRRKKGT